MESCDSRKRNVLLRMKSVQEFAITFGEDVLRYSNGWQYKPLKHGELCSEMLAEPAGLAAALCLCQQPPAQLRAGHKQRVRQSCCKLPALGKTSRGAAWEGDVMYASHSSHFPDWQNGTVQSFFCPVWHRQKELNNWVPPQTLPPDSIQRHSLVYLFLFPFWQRRVGELHLYRFFIQVILVYLIKCKKQWGPFQNKVKLSRKGQRGFAFNQHCTRREFPGP